MGNTTPLLPGWSSFSNFQATSQVHIPNMDLIDLECSECLSSEDAAESTMPTSTSGPTPEVTTSRARNWCFTLNNPTQEEKDNLHVLSLTSPAVRYLVFQIEEGTEETTHIQGYLELHQPWRFRRVKSLISQRAHLEVRRGSRQQARDYCMKEETRTEGPFEYGTWIPDLPTSTRIANQIRELVETGTREEEIWQQHFGWMVRYHRGVREYVRIRTPDRTTKTRVIILYGKTGTGKSRWAMDNLEDIYWKPRGEWWDGYSGQRSVVIDDFYGWIKYDELLRLGDRYPLLVPIKCGYANFVSTTIAITSNQLPTKWYKNIPDMSAFFRRVEEFHILDGNNHHIVTTYDAFNQLTNN